MAKPIPLIVCGSQEEIARAVKKASEPEFETIRVIMGPEQGATLIPALLSGKGLPFDAPVDNVGTQNFSGGVAGIGVGPSYSDEDVKVMRDACVDVTKKVPWLRPDLSIPAPPMGPEYGAIMAKRAMELWARLEKEGKMGEDGVYLY